jgi:hypothetical protein
MFTRAEGGWLRKVTVKLMANIETAVISAKADIGSYDQAHELNP